MYTIVFSLCVLYPAMYWLIYKVLYWCVVVTVSIAGLLVMVSSELVVLLIVCVGIRAELLEGTVATAQCHKFSITHERMYSIFHYYMYVLYNLFLHTKIVELQMMMKYVIIIVNLTTAY